MEPPSLTRATALILRLYALLEALRDGPLSRPELIARLGAAYPPGSARRMIDRDIEHLGALGITIERSTAEPPLYTLRGGVPAYGAEELRALALIRDTFGAHHPQASQIRALLDRLTARLSPAQRAGYERRQASRAPVQPAIDYTPYAELIIRLERAISTGTRLCFRYTSSQRRVTLHRMVEPDEIAFYERHFYLVGYSHNSGQIHDFRIDRIRDLEELRGLPPGPERARPAITFRYRLAAALAQGEISQRFEAQRIVERLPNGDVIVEAQGRSTFFIVRTLLKYAGNAELLAPAELRAQMAAEVRRLAEIYDDVVSGWGRR